MCPKGYLNDTQAITLATVEAPTAETQAVTDGTAEWMADIGPAGSARHSPLPLLLEVTGRVAPLTLGGVPIQLSWEFKQLGLGQRLAVEKGTGPFYAAAWTRAVIGHLSKIRSSIRSGIGGR